MRSGLHQTDICARRFKVIWLKPGCAMWFEHNEELVAVRHAFYKACEELGADPKMATSNAESNWSRCSLRYLTSASATPK